MLLVKGYDGTQPGALLVHKAILTVSRPITHVELYDESSGLSFSSEYGIGPRWKKISFSHPSYWPAVIPLRHLTDGQEDRIRRRADVWCRLAKAGFVRYDTRGALGCAVTGRDNPWDVFCSEVIFDVIAEELGLSKVLNKKMTPQKLIHVLQTVVNDNAA